MGWRGDDGCGGDEAAARWRIMKAGWRREQRRRETNTTAVPHGLETRSKTHARTHATNTRRSLSMSFFSLKR